MIRRKYFQKLVGALLTRKLKGLTNTAVESKKASNNIYVNYFLANEKTSLWASQKFKILLEAIWIYICF